MRIVRIRQGDTVSLAVEEQPGVFTEVAAQTALECLTAGSVERTGVTFAAEDSDALVFGDGFVPVIPLDPPEVWCAGVTYERSRDARVDEAVVKDAYTMVYDAHRPELFLKDAMWRRTVGPGESVGIREDSTWNVPEAEIGVVLGLHGRIAGYTIGNDVSSRDIEGANPLYLPQAKVYASACSIGPAILIATGDALRCSRSRCESSPRTARSSSARRRRPPACAGRSTSSSPGSCATTPSHRGASS